MPKDMHVPEEFSDFASPPVKMTILVPEKVKDGILLYAYNHSKPYEQYTMGEAARELLMQALVLDRERSGGFHT